MFKNRNGCFDCDKCPQNNDSSKGRFCVAWLEVVEKNAETGAIRVNKSCGFTQLPKLMIQNSAAADRVTENLTALPKRFREEFPRLNGTRRLT